MKALQRRWRNFEIRMQKSARVQGALKAFYARYVNFCARRIRWEKLGLESFEIDIARGSPRIMCFWHEQLVMMPYLRGWDDHGAAAMVSRHADAQVMADHLRSLGLNIIELGTSEINTGPVREAVRSLRAGNSLAITVDGPMGPARVPKEGALVISGLSQSPIMPAAYALTHSLRLKTWDRMVIPLPWGRGVIALGDCYQPKRKMTSEEMADAITHLTSLIEEQERICNAHLQNA
ncbi:MAG: DUF374 domain-containing protein [Mangrovicoccus sp.]|nr:DUF374 domain-containing protein [Mangrovicoccus sp.]